MNDEVRSFRAFVLLNVENSDKCGAYSTAFLQEFSKPKLATKVTFVLKVSQLARLFQIFFPFFSPSSSIHDGNHVHVKSYFVRIVIVLGIVYKL